MKKHGNRKQIGFQLDEDLIEPLEKTKDLLRRTTSWVINDAIRQYVRNQLQLERAIQASLHLPDDQPDAMISHTDAMARLRARSIELID